MGTAENQVFKTAIGYKVILGVVAFVAAFIGAAVFSHRVPLAMPLGIGLALALMMGQKVTISDSEFVLKQGFQSLRFPFAGSTFRVQKRTGIASYMSSFRAESEMLLATAPGKKESKIGFMLSASDTDAVLAALRERTTVTAA